MSKKYCSNCLYGYEHGRSEVCEMYTPITPEAVDAEVDDMIEENRVAFRAEWFEYIEECED